MYSRLLYLGTIIVSFFFISCNKEEIEDYVPRDEVVQNRSAKRGVSFIFQSIDDIEALGTGISWSYNWRSSQSIVYDNILKEKEIDFCPMAWNGINKNVLREYAERNPQCEYLLGFNEPNLVDQANLTPIQAAERWGDVKDIADELNLKLVSPAMNYGTLEGYHDPIVWLDEFFSLVPIDDIEVISVHCYMASPSALKNYIERFKKYGKPIWLTEFCAWDGLNENNYKEEGQHKFMSDAINYLENEDLVERYAWYIPRGGGSELNFPYMFLLKNSPIAEFTQLGDIYTQMSTQDKSIYYVEQQIIEAEHYSSISISEAVGVSGWANGPRVKITTDAPNESLELYQFLPNQWVEYQIEADRSKEFKIELRHASFMDSDISISIDDSFSETFTLKSTSETFIWTTTTLPLKIDKGKHTIRIAQINGTCNFNWFKFY